MNTPTNVTHDFYRLDHLKIPPGGHAIGSTLRRQRYTVRDDVVRAQSPDQDSLSCISGTQISEHHAASSIASNLMITILYRTGSWCTNYLTWEHTLEVNDRQPVAGSKLFTIIQRIIDHGFCPKSSTDTLLQVYDKPRTMCRARSQE